MADAEVLNEATKLKALMQEQGVLDEAISKEILDMQGVLDELPRVEVDVKVKSGTHILGWKAHGGGWALTIQEVPAEEHEQLGVSVSKLADSSLNLKAEAVGVFPQLVAEMTRKVKEAIEKAKTSSGIRVDWVGAEGAEEKHPLAISRNKSRGNKGG